MLLLEKVNVTFIKVRRLQKRNWWTEGYAEFKKENREAWVEREKLQDELTE